MNTARERNKQKRQARLEELRNLKTRLSKRKEEGLASIRHKDKLKKKAKSRAEKERDDALHDRLFSKRKPDWNTWINELNKIKSKKTKSGFNYLCRRCFYF